MIKLLNWISWKCRKQIDFSAGIKERARQAEEIRNLTALAH